MSKHIHKFFLFVLVIGLPFSLTQCSSSSDDGDDDGETGTVGGTSGTLTAADGSPLAGATVALLENSSSNLVKAALKNENGKRKRFATITDGEGETCPGLPDNASGDVVGTDCSGNSGFWHIDVTVNCVASSSTTQYLYNLLIVTESSTWSVGFNVTCSGGEEGEVSDSDDSADVGTIPVGTDFCQSLADVDDDVDDDDDGECTDISGSGFLDASCSNDMDCQLYADDAIYYSDPDDPDYDYRICDDPDSVSCMECVDDCCELSEDEMMSSSVSSLRATASFDTEDCESDYAVMAVVTGAYDEIENVLAKLGYGAVDEFGYLDTSEPYDFDLYDGIFGEPSDDTGLTLNELLGDVENLNQYDIIFFNCGNSLEDLLDDPTVLANIQDYIEGGGSIYATDWSYAFIEDPFPSFMDFSGDGTSATEAETSNAAETGTGGITSDATVDDEDMEEWLDNVTVNDGDIGIDCYNIDEDSANARDGALNSDGTVTIGDFLGGWAMMDAPHSGVSPTVWISGPIESDSDVPLTFTMDQGDGRVLYSSYHTAHNCPTLGFWPQERILQYLVFKL